MFGKIIFHASIVGILINILLFGVATYMGIFQLQLLSILNIFLLNFVFLREQLLHLIVKSMGHIWKTLTLLSILVGCYSDYGVSNIKEPAPPGESVPNITVEPSHIDFGALNAESESDTQVITIGNIGIDTLIIGDIQLDADSAVYELTALEDDDGELEPGEEATFSISYDPNTYSYDIGSINIISNDPDESEVEVPISGYGDAPVIDIDPDYYDFGVTLVGCEETQEIYIWNIGNVDLIVDRIDYFITYPADLGINDYEVTNGPLPWTITPGTYVMVEVFHNPMDLEMDFGDVEVHSNDPHTPVATSEQIAVGSYDSMYEETFEQDEINEVDIVFVVDNSGSMGGNQTNLRNNIEGFMNVFILSGIDYHIGFITTDSASMVGGLIDSTAVDPVGDVQDIIDSIGTSGSPTEKGIEYSYEALQTGNDFGPGSTFWRNDAKLIIVYVSDEDDMSSVTPTTFYTYITTLKGGADYVTAHAVAGDYPGGCSTNGGAAEAYLYHTLVGYLHGTFLSICADDWGTPLETLANESILKTSFTLTQQAVEETIYVEVDGVAVTEWTYDSTTNAVSFNEGHIPDAGANIYISYNPVSECT